MGAVIHPCPTVTVFTIICTDLLTPLSTAMYWYAVMNEGSNVWKWRTGIGECHKAVQLRTWRVMKWKPVTGRQVGFDKTYTYYYTPRINKVERGVYWVHLVRPSVRPSVRLSICGQNSVRSVSSAIFTGSISFLQILPSNFRRCVACNHCFKIKKKWHFSEFFKFVPWTLSFLTWDPIWLNRMGNHEVAGGVLRMQEF